MKTVLYFILAILGTVLVVCFDVLALSQILDSLKDFFVNDGSAYTASFGLFLGCWLVFFNYKLYKLVF